MLPVKPLCSGKQVCMQFFEVAIHSVFVCSFRGGDSHFACSRVYFLNGFILVCATLQQVCQFG
jgi:hypothetical protein